MKRLCIDTSHRHLVLVLMEDERVVASFCEHAWKRQSETIFVELMVCMERASWSVDDIDAMLITKGPGSYTGIRIAMSVAKVLCTQKNIDLYTISTLQLYAGMSDTYVLLDARSNRGYFAHYQGGRALEEGIKTLEEVQALLPCTIVGDVDLLRIEAPCVDFVQHFAQLVEMSEKVDNVHALVPQYLKEESAYLVP